MKTIIAGSRSIHDVHHVVNAVKESGFNITELVSGIHPLAKRGGEIWADVKGVPITYFQADWKHSAKAKLMRDQSMVDYADAVISLGENTITALAIDMPVYIYHARDLPPPQEESIGDLHPDCAHDWFIHAGHAYCPGCMQDVVLGDET